MMLNALTALVTALALLLGGARLLDLVRGPPDPFQPTKVQHWEHYADDGHRLGPDDAAVTIVEFFDFECPFCRTAAPDLSALVQEHAGVVSVVYRHFPLPIHENAAAAAHASECAARFGDFFAFHDILFAQADSIGLKDWGRFADESGVRDPEAFRSCVLFEQAAPRISADAAAGHELGVIATPTFLVNDLKVEGYPGFDRLNAIVLDALARSQR